MRVKQSLLLSISLVIGFVLFSAGDSTARIIHLPKEYKTIQQAIDAAQSGDQLRLAAGVYKENITLKPGISIHGEDVATTLITGSPWLSLPIVTTADDCILDKVTIKGAKAGSQGAIYIKEGSPRISNCIITLNQDSGIVIKGKATPTIEHNQILENYKSAIEITNSAPLILTNELFANHGAGIAATNSAAQIKDNHIYKNRQYGIYNINTLESLKHPNLPQLTITGNTIENNTGGEILCQSSSPVIQQNTIANKQVLAIVLFESDAVIKNNKITSGGRPAIRIDSGNPIIEENTISGVLRFPFLGKSKEGSIKNNKVEIMWGPQFEMRKGASPSSPKGP